MKIATAEASGKTLDWLVAKAIGTDTRNNWEVSFCDSEGATLLFHCMADSNAHAIEQCADAYQDADSFDAVELPDFCPSTDWSQGGPLLENAGIATRRVSNGTWLAVKSSDLGDDEGARWSQFTFKDVPKTASTSRRKRFDGPTQLIAGLRCLVASKYGELVAVPEFATA